MAASSILARPTFDLTRGGCGSRGTVRSPTA